MPEYLSPGVYVEEITGAQPIEGVSTSTTGFVGVTQKGPLDGLAPVLVTSYPEFERTFGGYFTPGFTGAGFDFLPHAVAGFFNNGGKRLYIKRVANQTSPPAASTAANALENSAGTPTLMTRLVDSVQANAISAKLKSLLGLENGTTFTLTQIKNGITTVSSTLTVSSYNSQNSVVWFTPALTNCFDAQYTTVALTGATAVTAQGAPLNSAGVPLAPVPNTANFALRAASPGIWGNTPSDPTLVGLRVQVAPSSRARSQVQGVSNFGGGTNNLVTLNSAQNFYAGAIVEFDPGGNYSVAGAVTSGTFTAGEQVKQTGTNATGIVVGAVPPGGPMVITGLTGTPNAGGTWVGQASTAVFTPTAVPTANPGGKFYGKVQSVQGTKGIQLVNGLTAAQLTAVNANAAFAPPLPTWARTCEFDISASCGNVNEAFRGLTLDNTTPYFYGTAIINGSALLSVPSPAPSDQSTTDPSTMPVAPDGWNVVMAGGTDGSAPTGTDFVGTDLGPGNRTGIAALVDAPSISIIGAPGITEQDTLNPEPNNICCLRDFRAQGRGLRVYGARCITSLTEWKYINVRRLFIFLEASLDQGTQWAVFEPNDQTLWNRLIQSVSAFLTTIWREGGLMGSKPEEAYFVKCGRETMSQDDIDNGRLIMLVGVAPVFPAEFVIIRIGQWAGGSSVQEL